MRKYDQLIIDAGKAIGLTLVYSNNCGGWSRGKPYTKKDVEFNPLLFDRDFLELAEKLGINIPFGARGFSIRKARLYVTIKAGQANKDFKNE